MTPKSRSGQWKAANRERARASDRSYYERNRDLIRERQVDARLRHRYGITLNEYEQMSRDQAGGCAICRKVTKLDVDHCHASGKVRGLLCRGCNFKLGGIERAGWLEAAFAYLEGQ